MKEAWKKVGNHIPNHDQSQSVKKKYNLQNHLSGQENKSKVMKKM